VNPKEGAMSSATTSITAIAMACLTGALAVGCAEAPPEPFNLPPGGPPGGSETAKKFFIDQVHPQLTLTCVSCHAADELNQPIPNNAPQWLSTSAGTAYERVEARGNLIAHPDNSMFILQGEHMGPALTSQQDGLIREWLLLEVAERNLPTPEDPPTGGEGGNGQPPPPQKTAAEALDEFAACMNRERFTGTDPVPTPPALAAYALASQQTSGWGPCVGCHNSGWAGAFLDDNADLTFEMTRQRPYLLKLVTAQVENGVFKDLVPSNRFYNKGVEICSYLEDEIEENDIYCHPKYVLNPNVSAALDDFFTATYDAWASGTCDGPPPGEGGGGAGGEGGAGGAGGGA
jgi:hypothetical protein